VRSGSEALQVACVFYSVGMNRSVEKGNALGATHSVRNVSKNILEAFLRNAGFGGRDAFLPSVPSLTGWRLTPPMPRRHPATLPSFRAERGTSHLSAKPLLQLYGKNGGRFLRCARSCLARSGRNDGWGGRNARQGHDARRKPPLSFGEGSGVRSGSEVWQVACVSSFRRNESLGRKCATFSAQYIPLGMCPQIFRRHSYGMPVSVGERHFLPSVPSLTGWRLRVENFELANVAQVPQGRTLLTAGFSLRLAWEMLQDRSCSLPRKPHLPVETT
jgi:hypothetical protein